MNSPPEVTGPVNLGNPAEFTMLEPAKQVLALTGGVSPIERRPLPPDDPLPPDGPVRRRPDIGRARELLGWEPAVPLEEGLKRTVGYFRQALSG
jgi:UDP-glucuronate decarboxylase